MRTTEIERVECDGISLLRASKGAGARPLVLLHGIGSNARSFAGLMAALPSRETIAWDAPGYAQSAPLAMEWPSQDDYVARLADLLDRLGVPTIDLLGHSFGALVAGRFAVRHPARVDRLALASAALGYGTAPGQPLAPAAANRLDALLDEGAAAFAAKRGPRLVHTRSDQNLIAQVVTAMSEVKMPGYAQASRMLSCADLVADAASITTPALVFVGDHDEVTPPANCRRLFEALCRAAPALPHRFETIAGAGHAVPQERPGEVAALVQAFMPADTRP